MAEYPGDTPIPFVKILSVEVAPAPTVHVGEDVFLLVELVNMGTAETRPGDEVTGFLSYDHTVFDQETVRIPTIAPDGGSWRHAFKFEGRKVMVEWVTGAMVTNEGTIGEVQDDQRVSFRVSPRESADAG
jgi:hypothetical protein